MSERRIFLGLILLLIAACSLRSGSVVRAVASLVIVVPASIVLGAIPLWLAQQIAGSIRGVRQTSARATTPRSVWRQLSLSLLIGLPIWLLLSRPY